MWAKLENVFLRTGLDYARQGSYADDAELPNSFFTFWNFDTPSDSYYDNHEHRRIWHWRVYYYTNDPSTIYTMMDTLVSYAKAEGFIPEGVGVDVATDTPDYIGRMITLKYIETD